MGEGTCFFFLHRVRFFVCMPVISAVLYLFTGLAECLVDSGISCRACKLTRTPRDILKKKVIKEIIT